MKGHRLSQWIDHFANPIALETGTSLDPLRRGSNMTNDTFPHSVVMTPVTMTNHYRKRRAPLPCPNPKLNGSRRK
ncbi:hypothetical protein TNCV_3418211 [Trichonephila clavipes]|nr:hypothetical protein TNCV_3418211 [Trichonephila clavipes]